MLLKPKFLFISVVLLGLTACGSPQVKIVKETKYVKTEIPKPLLKKCEATKPYDVQEYTYATKDMQEAMNTELINSLYGVIAKCNKDKEGITDYQMKLNLQIEEKNNETKTH